MMYRLQSALGSIGVKVYISADEFKKVIYCCILEA